MKYGTRSRTGHRNAWKKPFLFVWLPILMNYKIEFIFVVLLIYHCLFYSNVSFFWLVNALLPIHFWKNRTKVCSVQLLYINLLMMVVVLLLLCVQLTQLREKLRILGYWAKGSRYEWRHLGYCSRLKTCLTRLSFSFRFLSFYHIGALPSWMFMRRHVFNLKHVVARYLCHLFILYLMDFYASSWEYQNFLSLSLCL